MDREALPLATSVHEDERQEGGGRLRRRGAFDAAVVAPVRPPVDEGASYEDRMGRLLRLLDR